MKNPVGRARTCAFSRVPKSNNFVWFSEKDGFQNLYYYSIDGKLLKQLTSNKFPAREILAANPPEPKFTLRQPVKTLPTCSATK
jgi:hypothetical protein